MEVFTFEALGTKWNITIDDQNLDEVTEGLIRRYIKDFEQRFSRFLPTSEVNQFREALPGKYQISLELRTMLEHAEKLRALTHGGYNVAVGKMLELAGYDQEYSFEAKEGVKDIQLPGWSIEDGKLSIDGPAVFDLGGIAKGYCIDGVAQILKMAHYRYFLVEAGGDMTGTIKKDGTGWRVALEWPGQPDKAFGIIELTNQAVAVSDGFRRRWQNWHHIVNPHKHRPVEEVLSCVAVASTAFTADCSTSGLFLVPGEDTFCTIGRAFQSEYVVFKNDGTLRVSPNWSGELF
jgi:thiamine biosynthesis lipoprotein